MPARGVGGGGPGSLPSPARRGFCLSQTFMPHFSPSRTAHPWCKVRLSSRPVPSRLNHTTASPRRGAKSKPEPGEGRFPPPRALLQVAEHGHEPLTPLCHLGSELGLLRVEPVAVLPLLLSRAVPDDLDGLRVGGR